MDNIITIKCWIQMFLTYFLSLAKFTLLYLMDSMNTQVKYGMYLKGWGNE